MNETMEKIRLKFRVSSIGETKWTEKWGVSLTAGEEFHVTDKLLKLPFQENPPKTVCVFSVENGALQFQQLDGDRLITLNGALEKVGNPRLGDVVRIGETIKIEILLAPTAKASARADELAGPQVRDEKNAKSLALLIPDILDLDGKFTTDGPSFTLTQAATETATTAGNRSIEINEPSLQTPHSTIAPQPFRMPEEPKIILAKSPHSQRDDSLDVRMAAMTESELGDVKPVYAEKAQLAAKQSFSEKILVAVAGVIRRDELNPPSEKFPLESEESNPGLIRSDPKISQGDFKAPTLTLLSTAPTSVLTATARPPKKPWIPSVVSSSQRLRGRALVFLVAAAGALMLAVGVLRISNHFSGSPKSNGSITPSSSVAERPAETVNPTRVDRGVPIEYIQEKVRKMRQRR